MPELRAAWLEYIRKTYLDGTVASAKAERMGEGLLEVDD
jgi:hypothetical protein